MSGATQHVEPSRGNAFCNVLGLDEDNLVSDAQRERAATLAVEHDAERVFRMDGVTEYRFADGSMLEIGAKGGWALFASAPGRLDKAYTIPVAP